MGPLTWVAFLALFFYLIPFIRLVTRPLRAILAPLPSRGPISFSPILVKLGRWEYLLGPFRDRLFSLILLGIVVYRWWVQSPLTKDTLLASSLIVFYNLLAILAIRYREGIRLKLAEVARVHSNVHPMDFFHTYYAMLSPYPPPFPTEGFRSVSYEEADYRTGEAPTQSLMPLIEAAVTTSTLARMAIMAFQRIGPDYGRDAFDGLARLWGSRVAQLFKARLSTVQIQPIPPISGKTLLLFNHKSYLDFALNFFALGAIRKSDGRHLRPRFIAAKDHFIDNPFIYSWISLGKVIENAGMLFINREKGKGWAAMEDAAKKLAESDVEIAVYPQGTRAFLLKTPTGERLDSGYYSTFTKKTWGHPLGHLKMGTAHLILDTLIQLKKRGEDKLNVLVTGIQGTGKAGGKGSFWIQTQTELQFRIAPLWEISTSFAEGIHRPADPLKPKSPEEQRFLEALEEIQKGINARLLEALQWHPTLIARTEEELDKLGFSAEDIAAMKTRLAKAETAGDPLPFILIDRIISLRPELWERFFRLLISLKDKPTEDPSWQALLQEVSERLKSR